MTNYFTCLFEKKETQRVKKERKKKRLKKWRRDNDKILQLLARYGF